MGDWWPSAEIDNAVRRWMDAQGLPVTATHYDFDREMCSWRHEQSGSSPTLRVMRDVLEDHTPEELIRSFDRLHLPGMLRDRRLNSPIVRQREGVIILADWQPSNKADT